MLVINDLLGMFEKFVPKFVKQYQNLAPLMREAVSSYVKEVGAGSFPAADQSFASSTDYQQLLAE